MNTDSPRSDAPAPLTVDQHSALRREMLAGLMPERDFDEIDEAVDPLALQRPAQRKSGKETKRVLSILDELDGKGRAG